MKKIIVPIALLTILFTTTIVIGDDDRYEKKEHSEKGYFKRFFGTKLDVAPVKNALYKEECGSCHFAYQPGLLPERSWKKMMGDLENHFDENAELDTDTLKTLTTYLIKNSADKSNYKRSRKIMNSLSKNQAPLRITETPYFIRKHDEIPNRVVKNNPKLGSFSKCAACHTKADKGSYDEDEINIPGIGRWED